MLSVWLRAGYYQSPRIEGILPSSRAGRPRSRTQRQHRKRLNQRRDRILRSCLKTLRLSLASKRSRLDSRFRGNDGSCLYGLFNMPQDGFSDRF